MNSSEKDLRSIPSGNPSPESSSRLPALLRKATASPLTAPLCLAVVLVLVVSSVPVSFFIHQIESDNLLYWYMAQHIAATGSPRTSLQINAPPFVYATGASYLYAVVMALFHDFGARLRGIQFINIAMICTFYGLSIRYLRSAASFANTRWVSLAFGVVLIATMRWQVTVMCPNSDLVPAIFTVTSFLIFTDERISRFRRLLILLCIGTAGFFVKISLIAIPIAFIVAEAVRSIHGDRRITRRAIVATTAALALAALVLFANLQFVSYYWAGFLGQIDGAGQSLIPWRHVISSTKNLVFSALPGLIVPNLPYLFIENTRFYSLEFQAHSISALVALGIVIGSVVSTLIILGATRLWRVRPHDFVLFAISVPFFAAVPTSTDRYLLVFTPLAWACVLHALRPAWKHFMANRRVVVSSLAAFLVAVLVVEGRMMVLRQRVDGAGRTSLSTFGYIAQVASIYDDAWRFLDRERADGTRLLYPAIDISYGQFANGEWGAVTGLPLYSLEPGFPRWAKGHQVLLVLTCRRPSCDRMDEIHAFLRQRILPHCYELVPVMRHANPAAEVEIDQLMRTQHCTKPL